MVAKGSNVQQLVNVVDDRGYTPLINATIGESELAMSFLLKHGANGIQYSHLIQLFFVMTFRTAVNARNKDGASAIHFAAADGSVARLELLCNSGSIIDCIPSISLFAIFLNSNCLLLLERSKGNVQEPVGIAPALGCRERASCSY